MYMALTETALKALRPRDKTYTLADERGLYAEVFPTGGVVWRFRYRINGKQEKLTLGKYPALTLKNARIKRDEAAQAAAMGTSPAQQKQLAKVAAADATTVAEFGERFFKEMVAKDRKDVTIPRRYFDKSIVPAIGAKPVRDVTTEDVRAHLEEEGRGLRRRRRQHPGCVEEALRLRSYSGLDNSQPGACATHAPRPQGEIARARAHTGRDP